MKLKVFLFIIAMLVMGCDKQQITEKNFTSERVSKTAFFIVNQPIDKVFPLYGAFEERKWAPGWKPVLIYPDKEIIEEGTTFKVESQGHGHEGESELLWIVSKYEPKNHLIQYLVSTKNRFWTITVTNSPIENNTKTKTTVTYTYTGLNNTGNKLNQISLERMYKDNLQDWADQINSYFENVSAKSRR